MAATTHDDGVRRWSTSGEPAARRLDYWVGAICEGFLEMTAQSRCGDGFEAALASAGCGPIVVNRVRSSAADVHRTREAIARGDGEQRYYLIGTADAPWALVQGGAPVALRPRELVLVDSQRSYALRFPATCETVSIALPAPWLAAWLPDAQGAAGRAIGGAHAWGAVLSGFVHQLSPELAARPPLPAAVLADQLGALLSMAVGAPDGPAHLAPPHAEMQQRIADCIARRPAQAGLTAAVVAGELGISVRTLHRHLAARGTTFLQLLQAGRLASARRMLFDPRYDRLGIAEIGRRSGFADASHFIRQCRSHWGLTPLQVRKAR